LKWMIAAKVGTLLLVCIFAIGSTASQAQSVKPASSCLLMGIDSVNAGSSASFTLSSCAADNWTVSCGKISSQASGIVTLNFAATTCTSVTITALKSGQTLATKKIAIRTVAGLSAVAISSTSQSINYGRVPPLLNAPVASGGNCGGAYTYQWSSSTDNSNFLPIAGATGQNYQPGPLTATTYFKRQTNCGGALVYTSNSIVVTVYAKTPAIALSPASQSVNAGFSPATLTLGIVSNTGSPFAYQWQQSPNNSFSGATNINGANSSTYSPGALSTTTYYRLVLIRNGDSLYSTPAVATVLTALSPGTLSPATQTVASGDIPALIVFAGTSGGNGTYFYQWYSSADNKTWTVLSGVNTPDYNPGGLTTTTWFQVVVTGGGLAATGASAVILVNP
jgi:hypothetical protein